MRVKIAGYGAIGNCPFMDNEVSVNRGVKIGSKKAAKKIAEI